MRKIILPLADGFEEVEAITVVDVLRRAGVEVLTVSVTGDIYVTGSHQISVKADSLFGSSGYRDAAMIVLPGGMPGAAHLDRHEGLKQLLADFSREGKYLAAICAAPMVLGNLKLLINKNATCYPGFEKYLDGAYLSDEGVVHDQHIITGKGAGFALAFALKLAEILTGSETASRVGEKMLYGN